MPQQMLDMLLPVAEALGEELLGHVAFVGGSTTAFLITDPITRQAVRFTEDIDLIVHVEGQAEWQRWQRKLHARGFRQSMEDDVICRMRLGSLKVDLMPDDENILGFTNRWYRKAIEHAEPYPLNDTVTINLLAPAYFIATKLEAYLGRGGDDPMSSHDLEDIINLVDGRAELGDEIMGSEANVRRYIAEQCGALQRHPNFDYAIQGNLQETSRADLFYQRWEQIAALNEYEKQ
ncbi:MAG: hypothetical protein ABW168_17225 [Sedimenticola sp.]